MASSSEFGTAVGAQAPDTPLAAVNGELAVAGTPDAPAARLVASAINLAVRTPLHALLGFGELLAMSELDDDQQRLVEQMIAQADDLAFATNRLELLLRLLAGDPAPPPAQFELSELLGEVVAVSSEGTAGIAVRIRPEIPNVLVGDIQALRQTLVELVSNAVRHGRRSVSLGVELLGETDDQVELRFVVTDTGPGLPEKQLRVLSNGGPDLPPDGQHVGLYVVGQLARRLGGTLAATNRLQGGAEIGLLAPMRVGQKRCADAGRRSNEDGQRQMKVLLVEDNAVNRILAQRQLATLGHAVDVVTCGEAAVAAVAGNDYDVVLMDRHLLDVDGVEATMRIRASEANARVSRRTPIVAVTADASPGHREECLAAGMDAFLTKPLDLVQLRATLSDFGPAPDGEQAADTDVDLGALAHLVAVFDGDRRPVAEMVRAYLDELPGRRLRLQMAIRRGSVRHAIAAAQSLRSSSMTVGAVGVAWACARILDAVHGADFQAAHDALPDLLDRCYHTTLTLAEEPLHKIPGSGYVKGVA
jgi:CheY-like chemotaxis protein